MEGTDGESISILDRSRPCGREMEMAFTWASWCEEVSWPPKVWLLHLGLGQSTVPSVS